MIPTTVAGHAFWKVDDPAARKLQRIQFHKNMAMLGGLFSRSSTETEPLPQQTARRPLWVTPRRKPRPSSPAWAAAGT